ncbi:UvrD-helicase domain-containing protein [Clostridiaceae bacterium HFYG-1003]|nr:UvrD-helicase domain-containing protein [Clostridiaceae bacterium HFYG-1003]
MNERDLNQILSKHNAAIIAPAGHGKTEMIVDLVEASPGKQLLLTHTNAGIHALKKRLFKRGISKDKYTIYTIASYCMKLCSAYPVNADITTVDITDPNFYSFQYKGVCNILNHSWIQRVLKASYHSVIVDEYQDCIQEQHAILLRLNNFLPVYVLGDPLQAIFDWVGPLVSWQSMEFNIIEPETYPWRWEKCNPELGQYLVRLRESLSPTLQGDKVKISTQSYGKSVSRIHPINRTLSYLRKELKEYNSVLYITKWPKQQQTICKLTGGLFQYDESQEMKELFSTANLLDSGNRFEVSCTIFDFLKKCAFHVNELETYRKHLLSGDTNFNRITKHITFGELITKVCEEPSIQSVIDVLNWFKLTSAFKIYRKELFGEMLRALKYAQTNNMQIYDSAQKIRTVPGLQKAYTEFKLISSRTVLAKGLEFECVVIDLSESQKKYEQLSATDYYVAMTRATKKIYLVTESDTISF